MISIECSDGIVLQARESAMRRSTLIRNLLDDTEDASDEALPISVVNSVIMKIVIEYCESMEGVIPIEPVEDEIPHLSGELSKGCQMLMKHSSSHIMDVIVGANFLDIASLIKDGCDVVKYLITGKTPDEIRAILNIVDDFTPEEREMIKKEEALLI